MQSQFSTREPIQILNGHIWMLQSTSSYQDGKVLPMQMRLFCRQDSLARATAGTPPLRQRTLTAESFQCNVLGDAACMSLLATF